MRVWPTALPRVGLHAEGPQQQNGRRASRTAGLAFVHDDLAVYPAAIAYVDLSKVIDSDTDLDLREPRRARVWPTALPRVGPHAEGPQQQNGCLASRTASRRSALRIVV